MSYGTIAAGAACRETLLRMLSQKKMTAADLAPHIDRRVKTTQDYLRDLGAAGKVHVVAWVGQTMTTALYAYGPGQDAPTLSQRILAALQEKPMTSKELSAALDGSPVTIRKACERLRWVDKRIYVASWTRLPSAFNRPVHVFAIGNLPDAPKPGRLSREVTSARWRKRLRAKLKEDPARHVERLMAKRKYYARTKKVVAQDPFLSQFAGLFGQRQAA